MHLSTETAYALGLHSNYITHLCCQGNTGREDVLFLRLYLLQSLLSYIEGNDFLAKQQLDKVCVVSVNSFSVNCKMNCSDYK